jgi:hypothetical protein
MSTGDSLTNAPEGASLVGPGVHAVVVNWKSGDALSGAVRQLIQSGVRCTWSSWTTGPATVLVEERDADLEVEVDRHRVQRQGDPLGSRTVAAPSRMRPGGQG